MTCTQTQPLLDAYVDGELSRLAAFRLRRHLSACTSCAAALADIWQLHHRVQAWRDLPAPVGLGTRIAAVLPPAHPLPARLSFPVRPAAVGLASIAAALAAVLWFLPGQPGQPTIVYADVEKAMQQVQTVSWVETMEFYNSKNRIVPRAAHRSTHWLRTNPPALAALGDGVQDLTDAQGERVRLAPGVYADFSAGASAPRIGIDETVHNLLQEITQPQVSTGFMGYGGTARDQLKFTSVRQQTVVLEGQKRILFVRDQEITAQRRHGAPNHYLYRISVWADPATRRVVRIETRDLSGFAQGSGSVITRSDFSYNQPPPAGVFDWFVPAGATVLYGKAAVNGVGYYVRYSVKKQ